MQEYPYIFTNENSDVDWEPDTALKLGRVQQNAKKQVHVEENACMYLRQLKPS